MWHGPMQEPWVPGAGWGWGMGLLMLLFGLFILAGVIFLVWFLVSIARSGGPSAPQETALEILKKRYAQGEIGSEQYQQMKRDLEA